MKRRSPAVSRGRQLRHLTQLVGRVGEMAMLNDRWQQAAGGDGQVSGVGRRARHRQVAAYRGLERQHPPRVADPSCATSARPITLRVVTSPFIRQLEWAAGWEAGEDSAQRLARLEGLVGTGQAQFAEQVALLAHLMSLDTRGCVSTAGSDAGATARSHAAAVRGQVAATEHATPCAVRV